MVSAVQQQQTVRVVRRSKTAVSASSASNLQVQRTGPGRRGRPPKKASSHSAAAAALEEEEEEEEVVGGGGEAEAAVEVVVLDANGVPIQKLPDLIPVTTNNAPLHQEEIVIPAPRKRGRPKKNANQEMPFTPLDSNTAPRTASQPLVTPRRRCEDCNVFLKNNPPPSQTLCNDCNFDPSIINDEDDEDMLILPHSKSSINPHRKRSGVGSEGRYHKKRYRTMSRYNENEIPNIINESFHDGEQQVPYPSFYRSSRVNSPTPTVGSTSDHSDGSLPKRFPCPTTEQQHYYNPHSAYFYPSPAALEEPSDRMEFLVSRIQEMDQFQLAQVLCSLDRETRREFDRALMVSRDASLDLARMEDDTWVNICSIFANHSD